MDSFEFDLFVDDLGNPQKNNRVLIKIISDTQREVTWITWHGLRSIGFGADRITIGLYDGCSNCQSRAASNDEGMNYCVKHGSEKRGIRYGGVCSDWRIRS